MKIPFYQVDAFASKVFQGNPAAVCPLDSWLDDELMQKIAMENNLAETVFFVPYDNGFEIRWFTPTTEVNLCGHATLAAAYVIWTYLDYTQECISFNSKSGVLNVKKNEEMIEMDFPSEPAVSCPTPKAILEAFNEIPLEVLKSVDYIVVFKKGTDLTKIDVNLNALKKLDLRGVCITTLDDKYDFVSRFFAPNYGIDEDHVTGSAYTQLTPYWHEKLGKSSFTSKQLSSRGGELNCSIKSDRVLISGSAVCCIVGELIL